jgi:hypothetical protein
MRGYCNECIFSFVHNYLKVLTFDAALNVAVVSHSALVNMFGPLATGLRTQDRSIQDLNLPDNI